jgi:hypothetical protein
MVTPVVFGLTNRCCGKIPNPVGSIDSESARAFFLSAFIFDLLVFLGGIGVGIWMATTGAPLAQIGYGLFGVSALIAILYIAGVVKQNFVDLPGKNSICNEVENEAAF